MGKNWMFNTLIRFGFTQTEAKVYLFLVGEAPKKGREITEALKLQKQNLYCILKNLQSKRFVRASKEYPRRFSAVPLEEALEILIEAKREQQKALQASKKELLSTWQSMTE